MSAMMSPLFRVAEYGVEEYNLYDIRAHWTFKNEMEIENDKNNGLIFPKGCKLGQIKSISFSKPGPFTLKLCYDQPMEGFNSVLASYELTPPAITEKEFK